MPQLSDTLYQQDEGLPSSFRFDEKVSRVFADMIRRSVPGYGLTLEMIHILASEYAGKGSTLYDLGCSLGASILAMRHAVEGRGCRIVGIDNSSAMIRRCRELITNDQATTAVELCCADVCDYSFEPCAVAVINFTLQFIPPSRRLPLLQRLANSLKPGGILVLSEKIAFAEPWENELQRRIHEAFKARQGYSQLEISRKRQALEDVLQAETLTTHRQRLQQAGFARSSVWFQCANFASLVAFR